MITKVAVDHLNLVLNALRHQEKITRYQEDIAELTERLEEQKIVVEDANDALEESQAQFEQTEIEIDAVRAQLADYQQAIRCPTNSRTSISTSHCSA